MKIPLTHRQQAVIAQGCLTNSKHPKAHPSAFPTHIIKAHGAKVWDESGKVYIDYICALGASSIGYGNETVNRSMQQAMAMGASHSFSTQYEIAAAEKLKEMMPWVEKVKFVKTGSNACTTALKIARAATGRSIILSDGYHGEASEFCDVYNRGASFDAMALEHDFSNITSNVAAVIIEPVITDWSEARCEWLHSLQKVCAHHGVLVIWDEIITGFRWPKFSVAQWLNIRPDLICLGKAMANGMPLAAVAGVGKLMDDASYFASTTYGGEILSLAAATATMTLILSKKMDVDRLWQSGAQFYERFNALAQGNVTLEGYPTRGRLAGSAEKVALFRQEACKAGLLFGPSFFYNYEHMKQEIQDQTFAALEGVFKKLRDGRASLEGPLPAAALVQRVRA